MAVEMLTSCHSSLEARSSLFSHRDQLLAQAASALTTVLSIRWLNFLEGLASMARHVHVEGLMDFDFISHVKC